jgi:hypothetical protein
MRPEILLFCAMLILPTSLADDCAMTTQSPDVDTDPLGLGAGPRFYVEDGTEQCAFTGLCLFSIWIYEGTNGVDGLQRQDEVRDDTCGGRFVGDTVRF